MLDEIDDKNAFSRLRDMAPTAKHLDLMAEEILALEQLLRALAKQTREADDKFAATAVKKSLP